MLCGYGPLANFTPGHQETYVDFRNENRAPLLFIAGDEDNIMPPAVNQSNVKHYRHAKTVTDYKESPGRCHYSVIGGEGWEEVADYALAWATEHAATGDGLSERKEKPLPSCKKLLLRPAEESRPSTNLRPMRSAKLRFREPSARTVR